MQDSGAVLLTDEGRRSFIKTWQDKKREELKHPYLGEKLKWGLIPYIQAAAARTLSSRRLGRLSAVSVEIKLRGSENACADNI